MTPTTRRTAHSPGAWRTRCRSTNTNTITAAASTPAAAATAAAAPPKPKPRDSLLPMALVVNLARRSDRIVALRKLQLPFEWERLDAIDGRQLAWRYTHHGGSNRSACSLLAACELCSSLAAFHICQLCSLLAPLRLLLACSLAACKLCSDDSDARALPSAASSLSDRIHSDAIREAVWAPHIAPRLA